MIKKIYLLPWFLMIGVALVSIFGGSLNAAGLVGLSLGAVGLVYAFALWAVMRDVPAAV